MQAKVVVLFLGGLLSLISGVVCGDDHRGAVVPRPEIQSLLHGLVPPVGPGPSGSEALGSLRQYPADELIPQLLLFWSRAENAEQAFVPRFVIHELRIQDDDVVDTLVEYLGSRDEQIRKRVDRWLSGVEFRGVDAPPDFSRYVDILQFQLKTNAAPSLALVQRMYDVDASQAIRVMEKAYEIRNVEAIRKILWADHVVGEVLWRKKWKFESDSETLANAEAELVKLSKSDMWWVRLYVAQVMLDNVELRPAGVAEALSRDENELVRERAKQVLKPANKKAP